MKKSKAQRNAEHKQRAEVAHTAKEIKRLTQERDNIRAQMMTGHSTLDYYSMERLLKRGLEISKELSKLQKLC